ncbi:hypothetical protein SEA_BENTHERDUNTHAT_62 [Gordonia phage BENtherdunthat]|uniref:Uncharacterized protein n=1 Tax=Gordonia phage BENtherdunthat TaxID=2047830 RepID=A0A2H4PF16_9CAUD|nr:hypothetical protein HOS44_gp062 [Gordonia phage BENtherdunthat]ATW60832.1 hypothetical protein SEA_BENTHERDUNTHAT_62 [Gordonia phage BENtherdunthat]
MSHILLSEAPPIEVATEHGPAYIGFGTVTEGPHKGEYRVVQINEAGEITDLHCTFVQAVHMSQAWLEMAVAVDQLEYPKPVKEAS